MFNGFSKCGLLLFLLLFLSCGDSEDEGGVEQERESSSPIKVYDDATDLLDPADTLEVLAKGFTWSEGPLWVSGINSLVFSDVPENVIYVWNERDGLKEFLRPSGYTGEGIPPGEIGSNGLLIDPMGTLVICQHGDRRIARLTERSEDGKGRFETLADTYRGRRFNSPNDAAFHMNGSLYFTDPPYGLVKQDDDPRKEQPHNGVYRLNVDGTVDLLIEDLTRPNGIAFSPDHTELYVAQSDPERAIWMRYSLDEAGNITESRVLYDATDQTGDLPGLPDGLKVHPTGTIFATGPGGILVLSPSGELVARIMTGRATANCAFDDTYSYLYITADDLLMRVRIQG